MTRSIVGSTLTSMGAAFAETAALIELQLGSGTIRLTTAGVNLSVNVGAGAVTWTAIGGALRVEPMSETIDNRGNGVGLQLAGVDQAVLALLLGETFIGRRARIWWVHLAPPDDGLIGSPLLLFDGLMLESWGVEEVPSTTESPGTVTINTRLSGRYSELLKRRGVRCNEHDHQLAIGAAAAGDTGMRNVAKLAGKTFIWGRRPWKFTPNPTGPAGPIFPGNPTPFGGPGSGTPPTWGSR